VDILREKQKNTDMLPIIAAIHLSQNAFYRKPVPGVPTNILLAPVSKLIVEEFEKR